MTPGWALGNLYHSGVKVVEAWHVTSTEPSSHGRAMTGTLYPPLFVIGLATDDTYCERLYFQRITSFDPLRAVKEFKGIITHYISEEYWTAPGKQFNDTGMNHGE